ncbi:MAG: hypothetical protein ACYTFY_11600 [Planctomycetota bacterium]|jgi:hypothetical protein
MRKSFILIYVTSVLLFVSGCGEQLFPSYNKKPYGNIAVYKERLEQRLLHQYKNHPRYGNNIHRVELDVVKDIKSDISGKYRKVEFSQLVYDQWGNRIPELEKEYFIVRFGPKQMRRLSMPGKQKISVGLNSRGSYSEHTPVNSGELGSARRSEMQSRGTYCPVCGNQVQGSGICYDCANQGKGINRSMIGKTTRQNSGNISKRNKSDSERFDEEVTRRVKEDLRIKAMREGYDIGKSEYDDLESIDENITVPRIDPSEIKIPTRRFGGTGYAPAQQQNRVKIAPRHKPAGHNVLNDMRKNIDAQVTDNRIKTIAEQKMVVQEEDRDFGVVSIERRAKAEIRSGRY